MEWLWIILEVFVIAPAVLPVLPLVAPAVLPLLPLL